MKNCTFSRRRRKWVLICVTVSLLFNNKMTRNIKGSTNQSHDVDTQLWLWLRKRSNEVLVRSCYQGIMTCMVKKELNYKFERQWQTLWYLHAPAMGGQSSSGSRYEKVSLTSWFLVLNIILISAYTFALSLVLSYKIEDNNSEATTISHW